MNRIKLAQDRTNGKLVVYKIMNPQFLLRRRGDCQLLKNI
jgi:hypothetical protein